MIGRNIRLKGQRCTILMSGSNERRLKAAATNSKDSVAAGFSLRELVASMYSEKQIQTVNGFLFCEFNRLGTGISSRVVVINHPGTIIRSQRHDPQ